MKNSKQSLLSYELELYKQMYDEENNYKNQFSDRVFKVITVIISLIGALIWLIIKFSSIYKSQPCYIKYTNFLLLVGCSTLTLMSIFCFFKILYDYKETRQTPENLYSLIESYKQQTSDEKDIIEAVQKSLAMSYIDAAMKNYKENEKRIKTFRSVYRFSIADIILITITFLIEVFC